MPSNKITDQSKLWLTALINRRSMISGIDDLLARIRDRLTLLVEAFTSHSSGEYNRINTRPTQHAHEAILSRKPVLVLVHFVVVVAFATVVVVFVIVRIDNRTHKSCSALFLQIPLGMIIPNDIFFWAGLPALHTFAKAPTFDSLPLDL